MLEAKEYAKIFADRIAKGAFLTTCDAYGEGRSPFRPRTGPIRI